MHTYSVATKGGEIINNGLTADQVVKLYASMPDTSSAFALITDMSKGSVTLGEFVVTAEQPSPNGPYDAACEQAWYGI